VTARTGGGGPERIGGYRPLALPGGPGARRPGFFRWWPIARTGMGLVFSYRLLWLFFLLGLANFLFYSAIVYFVAEVEVELVRRGVGLPPFVKKFIFTGTGKSYRDFIFGQGTVVMLFLAFAGSVLVGGEFRSRAVAFYLSKPIGKLHYLLGKLAAASGLAALITLAPALVLFLEYGAFTESLDYFIENQRILWAILAYGAVVSVATSVVLLGIAALLQRMIAVLAAWGAIFVFLPLVALTLKEIGERAGVDHWGWDLLSFWKLLWWISDAFFLVDVDVPEGRLWCSLGVLSLWVALSLGIFWRRVRAVEVVR
jgi:hypothetical protein